MSVFAIFDRFGLLALLGFLALLLAFVALYVVRLPLLATLWLLTTVMKGLDWFLTRRLIAQGVPA